MTSKLKWPQKLLACSVAAAVAMPMMAIQQANDKNRISLPDVRKEEPEKVVPKVIVAAYPWTFRNGSKTSRSVAVSLAEEIVRKTEFESIPTDVASKAWISNGLPAPSIGHLPSKASQKKFAQAVNAKKVLYGFISWHTRGVAADTGLKTISTATVDVYVYDADTNKVDYLSKGVEGKSDDTLASCKDACGLFFTPIAPTVTGGLSASYEQRAVQIALGLACRDWYKSCTTRQPPFLW